MFGICTVYTQCVAIIQVNSFAISQYCVTLINIRLLYCFRVTL